MLMSTADIAPPNTLPVKTPRMNMMATFWLIPVERPMSSAIAIVVERPGIAPHRMPSVVPTRQTRIR